MSSRRTLSGLATLVLAAALTGGVAIPSVSAADIPATGYGWGALKSKVDEHVKALMKKKKLVGMTVAVTKGNRLILTRGYGYSNNSTKSKMQRYSRSRIGSVTKALITGPAGVELMKSKGMDPKTKTLYGKNGLFGHRYEPDYLTSVKRHNPIVAMAVSPKDHVFTWYADGTVSSGSSFDLRKYSKPKKYSLPPDYEPVKIRAIAIAKNSRVYVWYDDGTYSVGTSTDLDRYTKVDEDKKYSIAGRRTIDNIVGIAIAKSNDHVYAWYEDGTVSSGVSNDLDRYFGPKKVKYAPGSGGTTYNIRGVGIAKNDRVYAWFSNGWASVGTSTQLNKHKQPFRYTISSQPTRRGPNDWRKWYPKITAQHLLDHTSGFAGSGDINGAIRLFNQLPGAQVNEDTLTYEQTHKHFLRTHKLLWAPGTAYSYSNHGFGMWTMIIEQLSGKPYVVYVREKYLAPAKLHNDIIPLSKQKDYRTAYSHDKNGKPVALDNSRLGAAAGGYIAAAQDVASLLVYLTKRYSHRQLGNMGWGSKDGKLSHSGATGDATSYVAMFKRRYKSVKGKNLSRVHVVLNTNSPVDATELRHLADAIVLEVPDAGVPNDFDIW